MISRDLLWKAIIEDFFDDFLFFFFPELAPSIDFDHGFVFLDKDLKKLFPESNDQERRADQLVKVFLKSGEELWILIHVEVQGYTDHVFAKRMFTTFYRLWDRFQVPIEQLAIYTDDVKSFHPKTFSYKGKSTWLNYGFKTWKLLDHPPGSIKVSQNVFAAVMEVAWFGLKRNKLKDGDLLSLKFSVLKKLREEGFSRKKIQKLIQFLEYYIKFDKQKFRIIFEEEAYQTNQSMGILDFILNRILKSRACVIK